MPTRLRAIVLSYWFAGALALLDLFVAWPQVIALNTNIFQIPLAIGLVARRPRWRLCALVYSWIALSTTAMLSIALLLGGTIKLTRTVEVPFVPGYQLPLPVSLFGSMAVFGWQVFVLHSRIVRDWVSLTGERRG